MSRAKKAGRRKPRVYDQTINVRVPSAVANQLDVLAADRSGCGRDIVTRAEVVRQFIDDGLSKSRRAKSASKPSSKAAAPADAPADATADEAPLYPVVMNPSDTAPTESAS